MKTQNPPELLSPAGTKDSIYSAVNNGCNAIYLGGKNFNARKFASNFSDEDLTEIIDFCHIRGVKVLITLNILYKNSEINAVLRFVSKMYAAGADAFIVQDLGMFSLLKANFPSIRLHASTQMTAHNIETVNFLNKIGFSRIVLSRELSLNEIEYISKNTPAEIEVFVHGALCVSYSGRCLMSSMIGERSGNRGQCAQPCRMKYALLKNNKKIEENYLLSPKDIMTLNSINKLIFAGVNSFKIEGRMKSPEYVAQVTKIYRKYIDLSLSKKFVSANSEDVEKLTQIFNRGGEFSTGYLNNWAGTKMISPSPKSSGIKIGTVEKYNPASQKATIALSKSVIAGDGIEIWTEKEPHVGCGISKPAQKNSKISLKIKGNIKKGNDVYKSYDKQLNDELKKEYAKDTRKREVFASLTAKLNSPIKLKLSCKNITIEEEGTLILPAQNKPLEIQDLINRLSKTGGTPFSLNFQEIEHSDNIYLPIGEINAFRRNALSKLSEKISQSYKKEEIVVSHTPEKRVLPSEKYITVHLNTDEQFNVAITHNIKRIYFEFNNQLLTNLNKYVETAHSKNIEFYICFPKIYRKPFFDEFEKIYKNFENSSADGYLIRNFQQLKTNKKLVSDYTFNIFNSASVNFISSFFNEITLSPELTLPELNELASNQTEIFAYGRPTLMTTHQCPVGLYDAKKTTGQFCSQKNNTENYYLKDRMSALFPVQRDCQTCTASILNSSPICVLNKFDEIKNIPSKYFRLTFTDENKTEVNNIIHSHINFITSTPLDAQTKNTISEIKSKNFSSGHFFKGVL